MKSLRTALRNRASFRLALLSRHLSSESKMFSTSPSAEEDVIMEKLANGAARITLNRPKALNALNLSMVKKIYPNLKQWDADPTVRIILIKGAGDKAFCAGGDVRAVADGKKIHHNSIPEEFFKEEYRLNYTIGTLKTPYVALIDGITMGGGVGLSVHGPYRVATERTVFAMPETGIGLFPDVGGGYFLPRLSGKLGIYLALTGVRLKGRDVQLAGVATHYVASDKVLDVETALLNSSGKNVGDILDRFHQECLRPENQSFSLQPFMEQINDCFSASTIEGIFKSLENDGSDWAKSQLKALKKMSPTSMKVTLRQLQLGAKMSLKEDLEMEYRMSQQCMEGHDFFEGIRAVLVDRDQQPRWSPPHISDVSDSDVERFFQSLGSKDLHL
ncbi:3-hydroxyisobutyryl-CoA hydrolase, mitochondrial-like [Oscarella lobularis]|uniref:3-hydroxyisobutyryl-CoA hydrolase, mitochondrial-like n=1 Tax=Oscarella lobularis TaxID=121494 RepID=UPI0033132CCD